MQIGQTVDLPPDVRGIPDGSAYEPLLVAGVGHSISTGESFPTKLVGRSLQALSSYEARCFYTLHLNRHVVGIREQYPTCDLDEIAGFLNAGELIPLTEMPTLDAVVTLSRRTSQAFDYCGISVKPFGKLNDEAVVRRLGRDRAFCKKHGWGWFLVTQREVPMVAAHAGKTVVAWAEGGEVDVETVKRFAHRIKSSRKGVLSGLLHRTASELGLDKHLANTVFAHAVLMRYLNVDSNHPLALLRPLHLLKDMRHE